MKLDVTRIAVLIPATNTGRWNAGGGHWRAGDDPVKKYAVKNEPKSITSDAMKSSIPSVGA